MLEIPVLNAPRAAATPEHDIRDVLPWQEWRPGLARASLEQRPVLCLAEDAWSNGAQRLALFLRNDPALVELISRGFVPILVSARERPDIVDLIVHASWQLTGRVSPPLLAICSEDGLPFMTFAGMLFEGGEGQPTLMGLLTAAGRHYAMQSDQCRAEALRLAQPHGHGAVAVVGQIVGQAVDELADQTATCPPTRSGAGSREVRSRPSRASWKACWRAACMTRSRGRSTGLPGAMGL